MFCVMTNGCKTTREDGIMRITRRLCAAAAGMYSCGKQTEIKGEIKKARWQNSKETEETFRLLYCENG